MPKAEVVVEPRLVTDAVPGGHDVLACGPEPMLRAVAALPYQTIQAQQPRPSTSVIHSNA